MKKITLLIVAIALPFVPCEGGPKKDLPVEAKKDGWHADAGKHFAEPASENIADAMGKAADKIENAVNRACDSFDGAVETTNQTLTDLPGEVQGVILVVGAASLVCYTVHSASWYTYHYLNGTLNAELEKNKAEEEKARRTAEEEKLKALIAAQEAARLKRNAEIETEFNKCYMDRFHSPTRRRDGIPSGCELQGFQLISTGKFKSMRELKEYYSN